MSAIMSGFFFIAAIVTCFAVLAVLIFGVLTFARGGAFNRKWSNKIMRLRILVQFIAVILILLAVGLARMGN